MTTGWMKLIVTLVHGSEESLNLESGDGFGTIYEWVPTPTFSKGSKDRVTLF